MSDWQPTCPSCGDLADASARTCEGCGARLFPTFDGGQGYLELRLPAHRLAQRNGRVREHRLIAEATLGRALRPEEVVHHINADRADNRPENLLVCADNAAHRRLHRKSA